MIDKPQDGCPRPNPLPAVRRPEGKATVRPSEDGDMSKTEKAVRLTETVHGAG